MMETFKVLKIKGNNKEIIDDSVVEEAPFTIIIGDHELVTLLCMPSDLEDLTIGFLFTSSLIKKAQDIKNIVINHERGVAYVDLVNPDVIKDFNFKRVYTSGCGRGTLFYSAADIINRLKVISDFRIDTAKINILMTDFHKKSEIYLKTGGVHSAALTDENGILIFKEDIGRHNAIDKVIGYRLKQGGGFADKIIISSGRISSEVIFKVQKTGVPIVISHSAPTNQAVKLARESNITLVGFARGTRMNVYSQDERIVYATI
jgi:FdhD protein